MSRNFGLGSRDMGKAGRFALNTAARQGAVSYSTAATLGERWQPFVAFARGQGVRQMEYVHLELVVAYGRQLALRVARGELSASYAQNLVSAVNTVMSHATRSAWASVSPTRACEIEQRSLVRTSPATGLDRDRLGHALAEVRQMGLERAVTVAELARAFGLRSKEGALLDASRALQEALRRGVVSITAGTKGGRPRTVPVTSDHQLAALERGAHVQGDARSLIPPGQTWAAFRAGELREVRERLQEHGIKRLHDLRAAYACERYAALTGHTAPVLGGEAGKWADRAARAQVAAELGHGRTDVTNAYLGGHR